MGNVDQTGQAGTDETARLFLAEVEEDFCSPFLGTEAEGLAKLVAPRQALFAWNLATHLLCDQRAEEQASGSST